MHGNEVEPPSKRRDAATRRVHDRGFSRHGPLHDLVAILEVDDEDLGLAARAVADGDEGVGLHGAGLRVGVSLVSRAARRAWWEGMCLGPCVREGGGAPGSKARRAGGDTGALATRVADSELDGICGDPQAREVEHFAKRQWDLLCHGFAGRPGTSAAPLRPCWTARSAAIPQLRRWAGALRRCACRVFCEVQPISGRKHSVMHLAGDPTELFPQRNAHHRSHD